MAAAVEVVAQREVLIDDLDPVAARVQRTVQVHRRAVQPHLAGGRREVARHDPHQGRLAGAVVTHQAEHFAGSSESSTSLSARIAPKLLDIPRSSSTGPANPGDPPMDLARG